MTKTHACMTVQLRDQIACFMREIGVNRRGPYSTLPEAFHVSRVVPWYTTVIEATKSSRVSCKISALFSALFHTFFPRGGISRFSELEPFQ